MMQDVVFTVSVIIEQRINKNKYLSVFDSRINVGSGWITCLGIRAVTGSFMSYCIKGVSGVCQFR